jgi:glycine/D-amino acid oxidase-like deaminating enzyme
MEVVDTLIVGQGLAGTWLSWWLHRSGISFKMIDQPCNNSASIRAAGLINPVTGRRIVTTWMIDELMPFAFHAYQEIGKFLNESLIKETAVIDFFPSIQMLEAFHHRYEEDQSYLHPGLDPEKYSEWFRSDLGWGAIEPCYLVNVGKLISRWREWLVRNNYLTEGVFDISGLQQNQHGVEYSGVHASYIVFCDGKSTARNPYFEKLPFALNKGEGLIVEIDGLPEDLIFKKGMSIVPCGKSIFWLGSSYEWEFGDELPSPKFRITAESWLNNTLKLPYIILEHFASIRPATLERRPFVGFHPLHPPVGILNGMGTKGCSLAPYFARQLVEKMTGQGHINRLADISRYKKILSAGAN